MAHDDTTLADSPRRLRAVGVAFGLLLAGLAVSVAFGIVFTVPLILFGTNVESPTAFLALAAVGQVAFLLVGYAYVRSRGGVRIRWPTRRDVQYAIGGLVGALVAAVVLSVVVTALGVAPEGSVFDDPIMADPRVALGLAALSVVLVAPAEELLFRGAIQGRLRESFGPAAAVGLASLVFGSTHLLNYTGSVVGALGGVAIVTVGGVIFGTIYERTGNLLVPVVAHGGYNAVLLVGTYLTL
ncbi:CPBP family intramembrane metalloprotease [Halomicroarcula limicola]|uniref:CPBP family intramembrane metalloprotease n=1 Tax=Haloarcula limicola TaxID=1429915 RepID=A0A8J7Y9I3_9EURY|nr:type II CAAX endopeptidase family protein [Halomicroarcula limicola]MBV0924303.1 CPBP family intramembrane metalloprotease [Halomicroarcula limicola]